MHECRAMGCTIQWRKGGGYPKEPGYKQREMWESHILLLFCVLELLSESIPSEDRLGEETVVLGKKGIPTASDREVVDTSACKNGFAPFSDKKTHSLTDLQSCSFWCVFTGSTA